MASGQRWREGQILTGPLFHEPLRVETLRSKGADAWLAGLVARQSERFQKVTLAARDLGRLAILEAKYAYNDGST